MRRTQIVLVGLWLLSLAMPVLAQDAGTRWDLRQVIPLMAEDIRHEDGKTKQDCEINAGNRFLGRKNQNSATFHQHPEFLVPKLCHGRRYATCPLTCGPHCWMI